MSNQYKYGLLGCFSDFRLSCLTLVAPCYTQGKNAEHFGEDCIIHGLIGMAGVGLGPVIRWRLRQEKGIEGSILKDGLSYTFCPCCAAVQDAREIGWSLPKEVANLGEDGPDQTQSMARE